jgi:hypothetical protein
MAASNLIFDRSDYDRLQTAKRLLHDVLPKIDKAQSCGIECEGYRAIHAEAMRILNEIERNYFPVPPQ